MFFLSATTFMPLILGTISECDFYLAPSLIPGAGLGVFAGRDFDAEEEISSGVTLIAPHKYLENWQLNNYVYTGEHEGHSMLVFGMSMLLNHHPEANTHNYWLDERGITDLIEQTPFPFTIYRRQTYYSAARIEQGGEIFGHYGDLDWFTDRGIAFNSTESPRQNLSSLESTGFCLSDFIVNSTEIPFCGNGVFSTNSYVKGALVSVSPVLMLPKDEVEDASGDTCVLLNYCIVDPDSNVALLPITDFGLLNHGGVDANLEMEWYHWEGISGDGHLTEEGAFNQFANMYVAYRAIRDISAGEELLIDYGSRWVDEWNTFAENGGEGLFRAPIQAPRGMYPDHWKGSHEL